MLLDSKNAVIFAATGAIGNVVARTLAAEGAKVWLSGRNKAALTQLVKTIEAEGGHAEATVVDASNSQAVRDYVAGVAQSAGQLDVTFNAIGLPPAELGYPAVSTSQDFALFLKPVDLILGSTFLTSRTVGEYMQKQGSGSIITLSSTLSVMTGGFMAGISAACGGIEAMTRSLAGEFGPAGVRVNCVRGNAMPETRTIQETGAGLVRLGNAPSMVPPPLGRPITVAETARTVAFLASDLASGITGQIMTVSAGAFVN